jgi:hypothetical protein
MSDMILFLSDGVRDGPRATVGRLPVRRDGSDLGLAAVYEELGASHEALPRHASFPCALGKCSGRVCNPVAPFNPFGIRVAAQFAELPRRQQRRSVFRFGYGRGKAGILRILYRIICRLFRAESHRSALQIFVGLLSRIGK